jgi:prepilin-type N-terminal cleavage/methylation domain-containing protein
MRSLKCKYAVTLVEMLVVIAVIALLASVVMSVGSHIDNQAKRRNLESTFALLASALQEYYDFWSQFPDPNKPPYLTHSAALYGQLQATPSCRKILQKVDDSLIRNNPGAVDMPQIHDPWGTVLDYRYIPGDSFPELISAGPNRVLGTADDISSRK